jgi:hypothetical protein
MIDRTRQDIRRSYQDELIDTADDAPLHRKLLMSRALARLTPEQAEEFYRRLETLINEFGGHESDTDDALSYMLTLVIHPGGYSNSRKNNAHDI